MDKFHKKNIIDKKREEELVAKDEFADFEGSKAELAFLKFSRFLAKNRKSVFISVGGVVLVLAILIGFFEYRDYLFQKETVTLEDINLKNQKTNANLESKILGLESFLKNQSTGKMELRVW
jgi:cell division protein FtsL